MSKSIYPMARKNGLLTSQMGSETIVYDTETDKASCLNQETTAVWEACDGKNDIASILESIKNEAFEEANEQIVMMAIDQLEQAGLLEESLEIDEQKGDTLSRREMLRLLGAKAAAVLPVVTTIVVPPAIHAASLLPLRARCTSSSQCASGICCDRGGDPTIGRCRRHCRGGIIL